jgi:hypothetical protein
MRRIRFTWRWPFVRLLPPPRSTLLVVRLARMYRIHPDMGHGECALCREQVGIFPAGMVFLRSYPGRVDVVCSDCQAVPMGGGTPVPGMAVDLRGTVPRWPVGRGPTP